MADGEEGSRPAMTADDREQGTFSEIARRRFQDGFFFIAILVAGAISLIVTALTGLPMIAALPIGTAVYFGIDWVRTQLRNRSGDAR